MSALEQLDQLDADITAEFDALRHSIIDDYRDLESQSFGLVVTAVSEADRAPSPDVRTAAIIIVTTLAAWTLIVGDVVAAVIFGVIAAAFAALPPLDEQRA